MGSCGTRLGDSGTRLAACGSRLGDCIAEKFLKALYVIRDYALPKNADQMSPYFILT